MLAQVASLLVALASAGPSGDRLLTVKEAAHKLACSPDTLYKAKRHPARVANGRSIRFTRRPSTKSSGAACEPRDRTPWNHTPKSRSLPRSLARQEVQTLGVQANGACMQRL
jgi:hypothetical protein